MADFESAPSELSTTLASDHSGLTGRLAEILGDAIQALIEDAAVIELGTNDAYCFDDRCDGRDGLIPRANIVGAAVNARLDAFVSAFPASTCVIFVNVSTHNPSWGPHNAAAIDAHLARFPRVVDWDHAWQPDWFVEADNPHPSASGQQALVELIQVQLATCPGIDATGGR
jgi:lysophospholipase L1-like esterase